MLDTYFRPYAAALTDAVTDRLNACGRAIIIDLHSCTEKPSADRLLAVGVHRRLESGQRQEVGKIDASSTPMSRNQIHHGLSPEMVMYQLMASMTTNAHTPTTPST
ncbi:N-formylglutamate amidohydrolase [Rhodococcus enclensis]|nr:N-formylglutamate amidohydrolase [Rhodococcus qingshengii]